MQGKKNTMNDFLRCVMEQKRALFKMKRILVLVLAMAVYGTASPQSDCTVKLKDIAKSYKGACKKKLAHGHGEATGEKDTYTGSFKKGYPHGLGAYTWGNGNTYEGNFVKGKMDGKGILKIIKKTGDVAIQKGYFKKGKYIGEYESPYKLISRQGIRKVDFQESSGSVGDIRIQIVENGTVINPGTVIKDLNNTFVEHRNNMTILRNAQFPLRNVELSFTQGAFSYQVAFEIYKKGAWEVIISL